MTRLPMLGTIFALASFVSTGIQAQERNNVVCFPAEIDGLQAVQFSQAQKDTAKSYKNSEIHGYNASEFSTAVTVYAYDMAPQLDLKKEFVASGSEIFSVHKGTEAPMSGPSKLPVAGVETPGFLGIFTWTEGQTDFGSFLWVGTINGKYLKIRTTYIRPELDSETASAMRFAMDSMRKVASHTCINSPATF